MEFSWTILVAVVLVNSLWMVAMFLAQELEPGMPPRRIIIPGTREQKFLYMQDFWTMTYGDFFGVALVNTAFVHLAVNGHLGAWHWVTFVVLVLVFMVGFAKMCLGKNHKPDMGFPEIGKISWIGILHLPYFGSGVVAGAFCIWFIFSGALRGPVLYTSLLGAVMYAVFWVAEIKSGNFDPLKKV
jgi:predicted small integral membrane protein